MPDLIDKVAEAAEHLKDVVAETASKVVHAATEALHKGEHALNHTAAKASDATVKATADAKHEGTKVAQKAEHAVHKAGAKAEHAVHAAGGRILAAGTTSLRTLESAADPAGQLHAYDADTDIFITPGYRFRAVDMLLTNFHLPRSTLFMLVSAFMGLDLMKKVYAEAIRENYRFYSYGDACLLIRPR